MATFAASTADTRDEVTAAYRAWLARTRPCLDRAATQLRALPEGEMRLDVARTMAGTAVLDAVQEALRPVDAQLAAAARRYRTIRVGDRTLRTGARAQATELDRFRALGEIDACAFFAQWQAAGFQASLKPELAPGVRIDDPELTRGSELVERAGRRMRRFGIRASTAQRFTDFPIAERVLKLHRRIDQVIGILVASPSAAS
jgi:hypothetical protein